MSAIIIYHNGECSKCRGALELLQEKDVPHQIRWYLADPLSKDELEALLKKLDMPPSQLVRRSEPLYMQQYEGKDISEDQWLDILTENPVLIQRPIIEKDGKAIIARPPKLVHTFLRI